MELKKGTLLNKRYRVIKTISTDGGFSIIYLCRDMEKRKKVTIKELYPWNLVERRGSEVEVRNKGAFQDILESFLLEVNILREVDHPYLLKFNDFFAENNTCYLVYDYEKGTTLKEYRKNSKKFIWPEVKKIFLGLLDAVEHLHQRGILHRDIKPSNILVNKEGIMLLDFGSATYLNNRRDTYLKVTEGYSPIELYSLKSIQNFSTDIYSIFATLYYIAEGKKLKKSPDRFFDEELSLSQGELDEWKEALLKNLSIDLSRRDKNIADIKKQIAV